MKIFIQVQLNIKYFMKDCITLMQYKIFFITQIFYKFPYIRFPRNFLRYLCMQKPRLSDVRDLA